MATIKQLTAWIEASEAKLQKKQDLLVKYTERAEKALAAMQKSAHWNMDACCINGEFNYFKAEKVLVDLPNAFDIAEKYSNARYGIENTEKAISSISRDLKAYREELSNKQEEAKEKEEKFDGQLEALLIDKLDTNRKQFIDTCKKSAANEIDNAPANMALAEKRMKEIEELRPNDYFRLKGYKDCESTIAHCRYLMRVDREAFINKAGEDADKYYGACIRNMTTKLSDFQINKSKMEIHFAGVESKCGIAMLITDGSNRIIDSRLIWAAEYSDCVTAHLRFIVTERHSK